jgi:hypothetical protein
MAVSQQLTVLAVVVAIFCIAGSADAWCKSGFKDCDYNPHNGCETCIQKDVKNCGDCGVQCPTYPYTKPTCSNGKCGYTCSSGWTDCDHKKENGCEANTKSDLKNCGKCGVQCKTYPYSTTKCNNGKCESTCTQGWKDCNHNMQHDGCETDVGKDVHNCGGCGKKCPCNDFNALPTCSNGKCGVQCKSGFHYDKHQKKCVY